MEILHAGSCSLAAAPAHRVPGKHPFPVGGNGFGTEGTTPFSVYSFFACLCETAAPLRSLPDDEAAAKSDGTVGIAPTGSSKTIDGFNEICQSGNDLPPLCCPPQGYRNCFLWFYYTDFFGFVPHPFCQKSRFLKKIFCFCGSDRCFFDCIGEFVRKSAVRPAGKAPASFFPGRHNGQTDKNTKNGGQSISFSALSVPSVSQTGRESQRRAEHASFFCFSRQICQKNTASDRISGEYLIVFQTVPVYNEAKRERENCNGE